MGIIAATHVALKMVTNPSSMVKTATYLSGRRSVFNGGRRRGEKRVDWSLVVDGVKAKVARRVRDCELF
nr:hypothetical protein Iba_chr04eCG7130 [Ipomoea batatas]